ncbi:hypothetical protein [Streptosporangium sp. NPDC051022]|uniref:hypothetical protein n=1 Tax=Streptosporangium sp. NPDC051022 TaxID=3155752 RepID=UPI003448616D
MTLWVILYGLTCAMCGEIDQLWQDVVRGVVECRCCGARAWADGADCDTNFDGDFDTDFDTDFDGWIA